MPLDGGLSAGRCVDAPVALEHVVESVLLEVGDKRIQLRTRHRLTVDRNVASYGKRSPVRHRPVESDLKHGFRDVAGGTTRAEIHEVACAASLSDRAHRGWRDPAPVVENRPVDIEESDLGGGRSFWHATSRWFCGAGRVSTTLCRARAAPKVAPSRARAPDARNLRMHETPATSEARTGASCGSNDLG